MLILDIPRSTDSDDHIRVGVIGSCRVRDLFIEAYKLDPKPAESFDAPECKKVWYKFSSFTHTPSQALQYYRFCSGQLAIPKSIQPLVFSREITPDINEALNTLTSEMLGSVDMFVVEVGTMKEFSALGFHINISYTELNLIRAGGKPLLKWWRSVSESNEDHALVVQQTLDALPSKDIPNTEEMASVIKTGACHVLNSDQLADSINLLKSELDKPIMIVPAFNVPSEPTKQRTELIDSLYDLSSSVGYHFYDPTIVVAEVSREKALAGDGADKNHYQPGFHYTLLKSVVPFVRLAVASHEKNGKYEAVKYQISTDANEHQDKAA